MSAILTYFGSIVTHEGVVAKGSYPQPGRTGRLVAVIPRPLLCRAEHIGSWPARQKRRIEPALPKRPERGNAMAVSFDQMEGVIWFDGKLVHGPDAKIHVLTHGLHYASAVFEGERAYGGEGFKGTEHTERLKRSAHIFDF